MLLCQRERQDTDAIMHAKDNIFVLIEPGIIKEGKGNLGFRREGVYIILKRLKTGWTYNFVLNYS